MYINAKNDRFIIQLDSTMKYFLPPVLYIRPESLNKSAIIKHMPHCFRVNFTKRTLIIRDNPHLAKPTVRHQTINIDFVLKNPCSDLSPGFKWQKINFAPLVIINV